MSIKPYKPDGVPHITPYLVVRGAAEAIEFYKEVFGAEELDRFTEPDGRVAHCDLRIEDSFVMVTDEFPEQGCISPASLGNQTTFSLNLYVPEVDVVYKSALEAGATSIMEPADMFWGNRIARIKDPFGHEWMLSTKVEQVSLEEAERRHEFFTFAPRACSRWSRREDPQRVRKN